MSVRALVLALIGALALASDTRAEDVRAAVDAGNAAFVRAFKAGDAEAMAACYTSDARIIAPGAAIASGRPAIAAHWRGALGGVKDVALATERVESAGDLAVEDGVVTLTGNDGAVSKLRYVVVWKRETGVWKLHRDIFNGQ